MEGSPFLKTFETGFPAAGEEVVAFEGSGVFLDCVGLALIGLIDCFVPFFPFQQVGEVDTNHQGQREIAHHKGIEESDPEKEETGEDSGIRA